MCESFGEIKSLRPCKEPACVPPSPVSGGATANIGRHAIVEYWDSRGAALLHDKMNDKPFTGSSLDLKFIWDEPPAGQ